LTNTLVDIFIKLNFGKFYFMKFRLAVLNYSRVNRLKCQQGDDVEQQIDDRCVHDTGNVGSWLQSV